MVWLGMRAELGGVVFREGFLAKEPKKGNPLGDLDTGSRKKTKSANGPEKNRVTVESCRGERKGQEWIGGGYGT